MKVDADETKAEIAKIDASAPSIETGTSALLEILRKAREEEATGCQVEWAQCGGNLWTGATTCCPGFKCNVQSQWYSQCMKSTGDTNPDCRNHWEQCGGKGWTGATCCQTGFVCEFVNENWSHSIAQATESVEGEMPDSLTAKLEKSRCANEKEFCSEIKNDCTSAPTCKVVTGNCVPSQACLK